MREMEEKVSVLLSTYNGERFLPVQLRSVFGQKGVDVKVFARDDGSTDKSTAILNTWAKTHPLEYACGNNAGAARSFLKLLQDVNEDESEWYAYCDQDDWWYPDKLKKAVSMLRARNTDGPMLYYSDTTRVGPELEKIENPFKRHYHVESAGGLLTFPDGSGCTMVFNRQLLLLLKKYEPEYLFMHDTWTIVLCGALGGQVIYDPVSHIKYRQHAGNVLGGVEKMRYSKPKLFWSRVTKFFTYRYFPSLVAKEILNGYEDAVPKENRNLVRKVADANRGLRSKLAVCFDKRLRTGYFLIDMKHYVQTIVGKL